MSKIAALNFANYVKDCKNILKLKANNKGYNFSDQSLEGIINTIEVETQTESYNLDPDYPDIETILDELEAEYNPSCIHKAIWLFPAGAINSFSVSTAGSSDKIITSDGQVLAGSSSAQTVTFDYTKDITCGDKKFKVRWLAILGTGTGNNHSIGIGSAPPFIAIIRDYKNNRNYFDSGFPNIWTNGFDNTIIEYYKIKNLSNIAYDAGSNSSFNRVSGISILNLVFENCTFSKYAFRYDESDGCQTTIHSNVDKANLFEKMYHPIIHFNRVPYYKLELGTVTGLSYGKSITLRYPFGVLDKLVVQGSTSSITFKAQALDLDISAASGITYYDTNSNSLWLGSRMKLNNEYGATLLYRPTTYYIEFPSTINKSLWLKSLSSSAQYAMLTLDSFLDICKKLEDRTNTTSYTLKINTAYQNAFNNTYIKESNGELVRATSTETDAVTIATYITNKNWTISYANQ